MTTIFNRSRDKAKRRKLRNKMTPQERKLWGHLRGRQLDGHSFNRQFGIGPYIVDFYCRKSRLIVEVDGNHHKAPAMAARDAERAEYCQSLGVQTVRYTNEQIDDDIETVLRLLRAELARRNGLFFHPSSSEEEGSRSA